MNKTEDGPYLHEAEIPVGKQVEGFRGVDGPASEGRRGAWRAGIRGLSQLAGEGPSAQLSRRGTRGL